MYYLQKSQKMKTKKLQKKIRSLKTKLLKTNKAVLTFIQKTTNNYNAMKAKIKTIWAMAAIIAVMATTTACNVTRVMTTKSEYFQRGDTAVSIMTKTTETYNAEKH